MIKNLLNMWVLALVLGVPLSASAGGTVLFYDPFTVSNRLLTNEYAYWNSYSTTAKRDPYWEMTSGSLFALNDAGWTGTISHCSPNATSSNCTDSAVFRLNTKNFNYGNVNVGFHLLQIGLGSTSYTPPVAWDGVHIFLRYQSEYNLYYASVNRRDGSVVIKKKCKGGSTNGGTYYTLASRSGYPIPFGVWQSVSASAINLSSSAVNLRLYRNGVQLLSVNDYGKVGCPAIVHAGATGIRGDNDNFLFDNFTVVG